MKSQSMIEKVAVLEKQCYKKCTNLNNGRTVIMIENSMPIGENSGTKK